MAGNYLRGALIQFTDSFPLPVSQLVMFQYNPETLTHTWTPAHSGGQNSPGQSPSNPLAVTGPPEESFSFSLLMDSNDTIADGNPLTAALAGASGLAPRLAALELLLFPATEGGGGLVGAVSSALSGGGPPPLSTAVPAGDLPLVFFIWGPGRVDPVRVTALTITEKLYDSVALVPVQAEAHIELKVLTAPELQFLSGTLGTLAGAAASYMSSLRQKLALANLANSTDSIAGMLPRLIRDGSRKGELPMFASNSRYYKLGTYTVILPNGQTAVATLLPVPPAPLALSGYYTPRQGDRLDLIAAQYLTDATLFWRLCDANNSPSAASLLARPLVGIPHGGQS